MGKGLGIIMVVLGLIIAIFLGIAVVFVFMMAAQPQYSIRWLSFIPILLIWIGGIFLTILGIYLIIKDVKGGKKDLLGLTRAEKIKKAKEKWGK